MKKIIVLFTLVIILLLTACDSTAKPAETDKSSASGTFAHEFPDRLFRKIILQLLNEQDGGNRSDSSEITAQDFSFMASLDELDISGFDHRYLDLAVHEFAYRKDRGIASLKGIEYFTTLKKLGCSNNQLTELDLSKNTALINLSCNSNQLAKLDLSDNPAIEVLLCRENFLSDLDLSKNTALRELWCYSNRLTKLDVSKNSKLKYLDCYNNKLSELNLEKNTALEVLNCSFNQLTKLNLSGNAALEQLDCSLNYMESIDAVTGLKAGTKVLFELQWIP